MSIQAVPGEMFCKFVLDKRVDKCIAMQYLPRFVYKIRIMIFVDDLAVSATGRRW